MRTLATMAVALFGHILCSAQSTSLLWRIEPQAGGHVGYVFGTVHSRDARAYAHQPLAIKAMGACTAVHGELDLVSTATHAQVKPADLVMPNGTRLSDLYSRRRYARVRKALQQKAAGLGFLLERVKPFYVMAMLSEGQMRADSALVLDEQILRHAAELGKTTGGLETLDEQLNAIDAIPLAEQAAMLYDEAMNDHGQRDMDRMLDAYAAADTSGIMAMMKDEAGMDALDRALITDRNKLMTHRMDSLLMQGPVFFAIGSAHLPGSTGVLNLLKARGYRLEAVRREDAGAPTEDR